RIRRGFPVILLVLACWFALPPIHEAIILRARSTLSEILSDAAANAVFIVGSVSLKKSRRVRGTNKRMRALSRAITITEVRNLTEAIRVAIVSEPETTVLADSLEALLSDANGFTFSRFEHHLDSGIKPDAVGFGAADVVVATLGAFQATNTGLFLASLQRAFPHRSVLVTTTDPDMFDFLRVLEMGASDFLLPPLRRSELLPRLMRQARVTRCGNAFVQKLKEDIGLKHIIGES